MKVKTTCLPFILHPSAFILSSCDGLRASGESRDLARGMLARAAVNGEDYFEARNGSRLVRVHHALDDGGDVRQPQCAREERLDRLLVRGVQSGGERTALAQRAVCEQHAREALGVGLLEVERGELRQI